MFFLISRNCVLNDVVSFFEGLELIYVRFIDCSLEDSSDVAGPKWVQEDWIQQT